MTFFFLSNSDSSHLLMEKTSAHWISPSPISFLCFCSEAKGNYWSSVIISISIGNNFNFPVKGWGLKKHQEWADGQRAQLELAFSFRLEGKKQKPVCQGISYLNWQWWGGIDKCAPGQTAPSAGVSQEGDRSKVWWEHAGSDGWEHSGGAPSYLFGLQWGKKTLVQWNRKHDFLYSLKEEK